MQLCSRHHFLSRPTAGIDLRSAAKWFMVWLLLRLDSFFNQLRYYLSEARFFSFHNEWEIWIVGERVLVFETPDGSGGL